MAEKYEDIVCEIDNGVATITINRPEKYNAFRARTCEELIDAFQHSGWDRSVGVIVLTGAGDRAFCTGGDQSAHAGNYDGRGVIGLPLEELQAVIRDVPKPVIAKVRGYAIGGGHVLALLCDLTIAAESARFGQVGPKVGSVDPGFGAGYRRETCAGSLVSLPPIYRRRSGADGAGEQGSARCRSRCGSGSLVPRDSG